MIIACCPFLLLAHCMNPFGIPLYLPVPPYATLLIVRGCHFHFFLVSAPINHTNLITSYLNFSSKISRS